jgi:anti-sigma regulatory factor (Ser/Thr protein kinase)
MSSTSFSHDVLLYRGIEDLGIQVAKLTEAARRREAMIAVAVPSSLLPHLAPLVGDDPSDRFVAIDELGRNPGRFIELWADSLATARRLGRPLLGIGQAVWHGRSRAEIEECWISEALFDPAFEDTEDFQLVCLYDLDDVDPADVSRAEDLHGPRPEDRVDLATLLTGALHVPPSDAYRISVGIDELATLRDEVRALAADAGLHAHRVDDLVLAANELASNSVRHGGGTGDVTLWRDSDSVWCDVVDDGTIVDPMVGRRRPPEDDLGGRGVWIAHQVCDLVQVRSDDRRTHVRVRILVA